MLKFNDKNIVAILASHHVIAAIYKGATLIWEAVMSCFGSGMWVSKKAWLGKEGWRETKKY